MSRLGQARQATVPPRTSTRRSPLMARFWSKVTTGNGTSCWVWNGYRNAAGYGMVGVNRKVRYAHRFAYEHFVGPIPAGLHIDHLCRNTSCVKPAHLEAVTQAENNRRQAAARRGTR